MVRTFAVRGLLALVLLLANSAAAQVTAWDAARDFSGAQNPNGEWTYGWKLPPSPGLTTFPTYQPTLAAYPGRDAWQDLSRSVLLGVYHNTVGVTGDIPTNMLMLQPDPLGEVAVAEWTAPADMSLHVQGVFQSLDTAASDVTVVSSVTGTHFSASVNSTAPTSLFGLFLHVVAGEKLDFVASSGAAGVNVVISQLSVVGNATTLSVAPVDTRLRVTSNAPIFQVGGAWTFTKQRFDDGFDTTFLFQISQLTGGGADGFAFVIQNSSTTALGGSGGYLGYDSIPASLAVEFDTFQNTQTGWNDRNGNHISVHTLGANPNSALETASIGSVTPATNFKDGQWHLVHMHYAVQPQPQLSIYLDTLTTPVLQVAVNIVSKLQLADGTAWVGFTGGTGGYTEVHDIQNWHFLSYDLHPPVLTVPANTTVEGNIVGGATTAFTASALDAVDGPRPVTCTPASGAVFPVGSNTVNCSAADLSGNTANGSFVVTVTDTTRPSLVVPVTVHAPAVDRNGASVAYAATATDIVDGAIVPACSPASGSTFALGTTIVTCTATDHAGNTASETFSVSVVDETAPVISGVTDLQLEATGPLTTVSWPGITATDNVDGVVPIACKPASGSQFAVGSTTVQCSAADAAGNLATRTFKVTVTDTTPPVISCGNPDGLWHAADVSIACTEQDGGSGLTNAVAASFVLTTSVPAGTETGNAATNSQTVCDLAGNCVTAGPIAGNAVDKRGPAITIATPANTVYALHQAVAASYSCADGGSGVAACNGSVANGALLDTSSFGTKQFTVNATDKVGNASSASASYSVGFNLCLLAGSDPKQSGSTIPVRLEACDYARKNVSSPVLEVVATGVVGANGAMPLQDAGNANPGMRFRYIADSTGGAYLFNLKTKGFTPGTYQLLVRIGGEPTPHVVTFQISGRER